MNENSPEFLRVMDRICNRFEKDWDPDIRPHFDSFLSDIDPELARPLLHSLIAVDVELRLKAEQEILPEDYETVSVDAPNFVEQLLAEKRNGNQLEYAGDTVITGFSDTQTEQTDTQQSNLIGPYRLIEKIGQGGMGAVWSAQQTEPIQRKLAIKVIRQGLESQQVISRFQAERNALAMMDHPNIARIVDAGKTNQGQLYFAMELVDGLPLTKYCDENRLGIHERLELFGAVCSAVQHAHQKGFIHRDLKPSNILVAEENSAPIPKVIDFGVAKVFDREGQILEQSHHTAQGQILGTFRYMSPEQASSKTRDVDTRSDVYALGIILYELLTGTTPLDAQSDDDHTMLDIVQAIHEIEPHRPSKYLNESGETNEDFYSARRTDRSSFNRICAGDLDWIVMRAIDKDPVRRYQTPMLLAEDVNNFLNHEPVVASPPSMRYRATKFVKKNRLAVTAAGLIFLTLIGGIIGTTIGWSKALGAESLANKRLTDAREAQGTAENRLTQLAKSNEILANIFDDLDISKNPETENQDLKTALSKRLLHASEEIDKADLGSLQLRAKFQEQLGNSLSSLGYPNEAAQILEKAFNLRMQTDGKKDQSTLALGASLATAYRSLGKLAEAENIMLKSLNGLEELFGPADPQTLRAKSNLANIYFSKGKRKESLVLFREIYETRKDQFGDDNPETLKSLNAYASVTYKMGDIKAALPLLQEIVSMREKVLGEAHLDTLNAMNNLGAVLAGNGKQKESIEVLEDMLARANGNIPDDHPKILNAKHTLSLTYKKAGKLHRAIALLSSVLESYQNKFGKDYPQTVDAMRTLAGYYLSEGNVEKSLQLFQVALKYRTETYGLEHPKTISVQHGLATAYAFAGDYPDAIELYETVISNRTESLPENHPSTLVSLHGLAQTYFYAGDYAKAEPIYEDTVNRMVKKLGPLHPTTITSRIQFGNLLFEQKKFHAAGQLLKELLKQSMESLGKDHIETINGMEILAQVFQSQQNFDGAESFYRECIQLREQNLFEDKQNGKAIMLLGLLLLQKGNKEEGQNLTSDGFDLIIDYDNNSHFWKTKMLSLIRDIKDAEDSNAEVWEQRIKQYVSKHHLPVN